MPQSFTCLLFHIVFATKERRPWLDEAVRPALFAYLGGIARESGAAALLVNGTADHVHLLVQVPAKLAAAELVRLLKANSSLWLHREHAATHRLFAWQNGYGAFSVSASGQAAVERYIANQETHHRRMSFEQEFVGLLKKHGIRYDERYLWE